VDVLVNNAGLGYQALYERASWEGVLGTLQVDVIGPAFLTHRLLPSMLSRGRGGILNIGSGAGFAILPGLATYAGAKHFLNGFSEALRAELDGTGVVVTHVAPGPVDTEFDALAGIERLAGGPPEFMRISAERCAREAIAGFERGRPLVFPGRAYRALMTLQGIVPRPLLRLGGRAGARRLRRQAKKGGAPESHPPEARAQAGRVTPP
jgi:hypothetical protein